MSKRPTVPRPVPVKEVLREILKPGDLEDLRQRQEIRRIWERVMPPVLLGRTRLLEVRRRELWVEAADGAVAQELQFLKPRLLEEVEAALGPGKIRDLRIRVGE
jgi:hypothetical protein